jgi:hypothetical protein
MKNGFFLLFLSIAAFSCKKKELIHSSETATKGELLILVVSDSLEYVSEYKSSDLTKLKKSPVLTDFEFIDGDYRVSIYPNGIGLYGLYYFDPLTDYAVDFPKFSEYYSDTFIDSIPGNKLEKRAFYSVALDTSKIDYLVSSVPGEVEPAWDKIKNLRLVYEYRMKYPEARIAFLNVKKQNGETRKYFFMSKYKP